VQDTFYPFEHRLCAPETTAREDGRLLAGSGSEWNIDSGWRDGHFWRSVRITGYQRSHDYQDGGCNKEAHEHKQGPQLTHCYQTHHQGRKLHPARGAVSAIARSRARTLNYIAIRCATIIHSFKVTPPAMLDLERESAGTNVRRTVTNYR
jgi:hypothetical protein